MTCSYGKRREWMSDVWSSVRLHLSQSRPGGQAARARRGHEQPAGPGEEPHAAERERAARDARSRAPEARAPDTARAGRIGEPPEAPRR